MPNDRDFLMCRYTPSHKGDRGLIGFASFDVPLSNINMKRDGGVYRIDYGYKAAGDEFLVHRLDLEAAPHVFKSLEDVASGVISLPKRAAPTPPPPVRLGMKPPTPLLEPEEQEAEPVEPTEPPLAASQPSVEELLKAREERAFDPQLLPGVTTDIAQQMLEDGIDSVDAVLNLGVEGLQKYHGMGPAKAALVIGSLQEEE